MRGILAVAVAVGFIATTGTNAGAQDETDFAAWLAMTFTPYGSLPPLVTPTMLGTPGVDGRAGAAFEVRYGRWGFEDDDEFNTFAIGGRGGPVGFALGYEVCEGCDDGIIIGGVDFESVLRTSQLGTDASPSVLSIGLRPGIGVGVFTGEGSGWALSGTVDVPISMTMPMGTTAQVVPFLSPGFGVGRLAEGSESETGVRVALGAGVAFVTANRFGIHLGWRKIFIEDGPSTVGLAVSFGR